MINIIFDLYAQNIHISDRYAQFYEVHNNDEPFYFQYVILISDFGGNLMMVTSTRFIGIAGFTGRT